MTLGFSTQIKNKPTYFVEKIWEGILQKGVQINANDFIEYGRKALPKNYIVGTNKPKIHTIREDKKERWKVGNQIHFVTGNRTKNRKQFAPIVKVQSIQKLVITEMLMTQTAYCTVSNDKIFKVEVDGITLHNKQVEELALNDGFDSVDDFFKWFDKDFKGKIIHWTDYKY